MEDLISFYSGLNGNDKVFGKITKADLQNATHNIENHPDAPSQLNIDAMIAYYGSHANICSMLDCFANLGDLFPQSEIIHSLDDALAQGVINNSQYQQLKDNLKSQILGNINLDSLCTQTGLPLLNGESLSENSNINLRGEAGHQESELDIYSFQVAGLDKASDFSTKDPDLSKLSSNLEVGVNLYNGIPTIGMPLCELNARDISIPVSISNTGTGVKVNEYGTELGQSWSVSYPGSIRREMKGLPDEFYNNSDGKGIGPVPVLKPCGKLSGAAIGYGSPAKMVDWNFKEPNVIHFKPIVGFFTYAFVTFFIQLDFTLELNVRYKPKLIEYEEKGVGLLKADLATMTSEFGINESFEPSDFVYYPNQPDEIKKAKFLNAINGNKLINDLQFLSPKLGQAYSFLKGISNIFSNPFEKTKRLDYEYDEFSYNFPGHSGKFIIMNRDKEILLLPHENLDVKVELSNYNGIEHISEFSVTTEDGLVYRFGNKQDFTGVDFQFMTNYVMPNYFTYPELSLDRSILGNAQLKEIRQPFQGAIMCWPSSLEYGATYENQFTIKNTPNYTSEWHLTSVTSKLTGETVTLTYEKLPEVNYIVDKSFEHIFPRFDKVGNNFHPLISPFLNFLNPNHSHHSEWQFGQNSFTYKVTEIHEQKHLLKSINGNVGESINFYYDLPTVDKLGGKLCTKILHNMDGKFHEGWKFEYLNVESPVGTMICDENNVITPVYSHTSEFSFDLEPKWDKADYDFLDYSYFTFAFLTGFQITIPIPLITPVIKRNVQNLGELKEFGSLMQIKGIANNGIDIKEELSHFEAEFKRSYLKAVKAIKRSDDYSETADFDNLMSITYVDEQLFPSLPKRFSLDQDIWGYYCDNPSGSLLPKVSYVSTTNQFINNVGARGHYGFKNSDPAKDVTLGRVETPDLAKTRIGFIQNLRNEFGGLYGYKYELNEENSDQGVVPSGGCRVNTFTHYAGLGNNKVISYKYSYPEIVNKPKFINYSQINLLDRDQSANGGDSYIATSSSAYNNWEMIGNGYVYYPNVKEQFEGNGYIEHTFAPPTYGESSYTDYSLRQMKQFIGLVNTANISYTSYDIFDRYIINPPIIGKEINSRIFNENGVLELETSNTYESYRPLYCLNRSTTAQNSISICRYSKLKIDSYKQNVQGPFEENKKVNELFNYMSMFDFGVEGFSVSQLLSIIKMGPSFIHPFRKIFNTSAVNVIEYLDFNAGVRIKSETSTRIFADGTSNSTSVVFNYAETPDGYFVYFPNTYGKFYSLTDKVTTLVGGMGTVDYKVEKFYNPLNANYQELKMTENAFNFLKINKINPIIKSETLLNDVLINGNISPLDLFGGKYLTKEKWTVNNGVFLLSGKFDYSISSGLVSKYYRAYYTNSQNSNDYSLSLPIEFEWNSNRTLRSKKISTFTQGYNYSPTRELVYSSNPNGIVVTKQYNGRGRIKNQKLYDAGGVLTKTDEYDYFYGNYPNRITVNTTFSDGTSPQLMSYRYNAMGMLLTQQRNSSYLIKELKYDNMFRPYYEKNIGNGFVNSEYSSSVLGELMKTIDEVGNTTLVYYSGRDQSISRSFSSISTTDANGHSTKITKDVFDNHLQLDDGLGYKTKFYYDNKLRLERITNANQQDYIYTYNAIDEVSTVKIPGKAIEKTWFDHRKRPSISKTALGKYLITKYDDFDRVTGVKIFDALTEPTDNIISESLILSLYNGGGKQYLQNTYQTGKTWLKSTTSLIFDANNGNNTDNNNILQFDGFGRPAIVQTTSTAGISTQNIHHNSAGLPDNISSTWNFSTGVSLSGNETNEYDDQLRLKKTRISSSLVPNIYEVENAYNNEDQLETKWLDANKFQEINYEYDKIGRLKKINDFATTSCQKKLEHCFFKVFIPSYNNIKAYGLFVDNVYFPFQNPVNGGYAPHMQAAVTWSLDNSGAGGTVNVYNGVQGPFRGIFIEINMTFGQSFSLSTSNGNFTFELVKCCEIGGGVSTTPKLRIDPVADIFAEHIEYSGLDISKIKLNNNCDNGELIRDYIYDAKHMLKTVNSRIISSAGNIFSPYDEAIDYDPIGGIKIMNRSGLINPQSNSYGSIDRLTYSYDNTTGRLTSVTDGAAGAGQPKGFKPNSSSYLYDAAGNITSDGGKQMTIQYNPLNLPKTITTIDGNIYIDYTSNGSKIKVRENLTIPSAPGEYPKTRYYLGGAEIENGNIVILHLPDGRIMRDINTNQAAYIEYVIKDHLGNTAVTFGDKNNDGTFDIQTEIAQRNNYYSFGLEMDGKWDNTSDVKNRYLYNGKEFEEFNGLKWSDYGARWYMPEIGRWNSTDPMAHMRVEWTPYNAMRCNPINNIDPTGALDAPIYDTEGTLLGTDDQGLQGKAIVMDKDKFQQGMKHEDALKNSKGYEGLKDDAAKKNFSESYKSLSSRPDYDGKLTLDEANKWYREGGGKPLFVDASKIDLSPVVKSDFGKVGDSFYKNFAFTSNTETGLVYGNIKLTLMDDKGVIKLGGAKGLLDIYDFDYKSGAKNIPRNIATWIGEQKAGKGTGYNIFNYGTGTVK